MQRTNEIIEKGSRDGLHVGAQLSVIHDGRPTDLAWGLARQDLAMTTGTAMLWASAGKPLTAAGIMALWDENELSIDDPVAIHVPGYPPSVTIRHLLTHTSGARSPANAVQRSTMDYDQIVASIVAAGTPEGWIPGRRAAYSQSANWYLLGEVLRKVTNAATFEEAIAQTVLRPAGLGRVTFRPAEDGQAGVLMDTRRRPPTPNDWDSQMLSSPGGGARGPIAELARFYETLRAGGLLTPQTREAMIARHRVGLSDETFGCVIDWGLGVIVNSEYVTPRAPYGFGRYASMRTYGHGGYESSAGFCDPEARLCVAWLCNGTPGPRRAHERHHAICEAVYEDLGLA